eukprot:CAMPEP_0196730408 /NCGR_PEP_ID=MMETSP1091-20130531/10468_1 /TAXON_ID=302021 /ORGANISM="Rhodomonas sp., Strain CCMP768" /LENGTH=283 /DNA_ID=CAMNT_0042073401 /DNA_START=10 /DNA_END=861 /DNA_ORIENTATION=+
MAETEDAPMPPAPEDAPPAANGPEPNQTLYIKNLDESLSRRYRLEELKGKLKNLFRPYGEILDIVALSNFYDKGQAFVVFKSTEMAEKAMAALQGHVMSGKEMRIFFAKGKSDAVAKLDGSYRPREKRVRPKPQSKPKGGDGNMVDASGAVPPAAPSGAPPPFPGGAPPPAPAGFGGGGGGGFGHGATPAQAAPRQAAASTTPGPILPHPILFLENLPPHATTDTVAAVFSPFPGFKEVRLVPSRPGIAFCEFENEMQSGIALTRLQGFKVEDQPIRITFSKS